jgi:hypothetical protein
VESSANVAANLAAVDDTRTVGTQKNIRDLTDADIQDILNNYPYAKQWDPKIITKELKLLEGDADYQKIYSKVWNMMDAFMTVRNTKCKPRARQSNRASVRECFNSYSPRKGNTFSSRGKARKGTFLGNPGQSAVTDFCANLIKNTAEREVDHQDPDSGIDLSPVYEGLAPVSNGLGSNTQCSTWCKDIHDESDQAVRDLAIKLVSEPDKWRELKAGHTELWPKVKKIVKSCSRKCPINVLNASCGYILRNQGLVNGIPFKDVCAARGNLPVAERACQISKELKLAEEVQPVIDTCQGTDMSHPVCQSLVRDGMVVQPGTMAQPGMAQPGMAQPGMAVPPGTTSSKLMSRVMSGKEALTKVGSYLSRSPPTGDGTPIPGQALIDTSNQAVIPSGANEPVSTTLNQPIVTEPNPTLLNEAVIPMAVPVAPMANVASPVVDSNTVPDPSTSKPVSLFKTRRGSKYTTTSVPEPVPANWTVNRDQTNGQTYYLDTATQNSRWTPPTAN